MCNIIKNHVEISYTYLFHHFEGIYIFSLQESARTKSRWHVSPHKTSLQWLKLRHFSQVWTLPFALTVFLIKHTWFNLSVQ